jgi:hypothetical protein
MSSNSAHRKEVVSAVKMGLWCKVRVICAADAFKIRAATAHIEKRS